MPCTGAYGRHHLHGLCLISFFNDPVELGNVDEKKFSPIDLFDLVVSNTICHADKDSIADQYQWKYSDTAFDLMAVTEDVTNHHFQKANVAFS